MSLETEQIQAEQEAETMTNDMIFLLLLAYSLSLKRSRSRLAQVYGQFGDRTPQELMKYNRLSKLTKEIIADINDAFRSNKKALIDGLTNIYNHMFERTSKSIHNPLEATKDEIKQEIQKQIDSLSLSERLEKHRKKFIASIRQQLQKGVKALDTFEKLANRLKQTTEQSAKKIRTIARTESHRLQNAARMKAAQQARSIGFSLMKVWDGTLDNRIRPAHRQLHNTKIPMHANFHSMNGGIGPAPGMMGNPSDDINCRCILRFALAGV